jgi:hypothetical protein
LIEASLKIALNPINRIFKPTLVKKAELVVAGITAARFTRSR